MRKEESMSNKIESPKYTIRENLNNGSVKIADDVIAMIAGIAATEVDGVCAMAGNVGNDLLSKVGVKNLAKGVKVLISNGTVKVNLAIVVDYGFNVPAVSLKVQDKVKSTIESMTGLVATDVNIRVAGVNVGAR